MKNGPARAARAPAAQAREGGADGGRSPGQPVGQPKPWRGPAADLRQDAVDLPERHVAVAEDVLLAYPAPLGRQQMTPRDVPDVDQVEVGMTRSQVRFLLGTPMIDDPFHADRWDYVYYLKIGRRDASFKRWVSVLFDGDRVSEIIEDQELNPDL